TSLVTALPVRASSMDAARGVPTFVWAARDLHAALGVAATPAEAALAHLGRLADLYRLPPAAVAAATVKQVHDTGRGGIVVVLGQRVDGVEVWSDDIKILMKRNLDLVAVG